MVTAARKGPHIVHCPDDGFVECKKFFERIERKKTKICPMQMNDVGCLYQRILGNINTNIGRRKSKTKGFSYFQAALEILKTQIVDNQAIELIILGESDEETNQKLPFKYHALGRVNDVNTIVSIYSAADVFVTSSIQENLPNTIMEAMACGTPAVGFEVGGIPEMIENRKSGFLAKYKSAESLAEGINWVLFEANHAKLSKNARQKVLDNYSEKVVVEQYLEVYHAVLKL